MTARTHDLAAITALGIVAITTLNINITLGTALVAILVNQLGGIAPDIDQPTAPFWRNLPVGGYFGKIIGKMMGGHRFLSHSLLGVAGFGFLTDLLLKFVHPLFPHLNTGIIWWSFMIGLVSHLVMDTFTKEGVPWLLPIPIKFGIPPIRSLRITTGKKMEVMIFLALLVFDIWLVSAHYGKLLALIHRQIV